MLIAAARDLGVPADAGWFLTFGQGDSLSRNAFQLFRAGRDDPEWVLKFARVAGYSERFDNDERGLRLAREAGDPLLRTRPGSSVASMSTESTRRWRHSPPADVCAMH